jgi:hypothetical protein
MAEYRRTGHERVNVFELDGTYLFKHYFESSHVFARLKEYYNNNQYRFEVPEEDFDGLSVFLDNEDYNLVVVDSMDKFTVVVRKYRRHPDNIFKASVIQRSVDKYNFFLMTDRDAVETAAEDGATPLTDVVRLQS